MECRSSCYFFCQDCPVLLVLLSDCFLQSRSKISLQMANRSGQILIHEMLHTVEVSFCQQKRHFFLHGNIFVQCDRQLCLTSMYIRSHFLIRVKDNPISKSYLHLGMHFIFPVVAYRNE